jgi:1,4-dihydroxy-2-naphthoyl-CoA hydrolase
MSGSTPRRHGVRVAPMTIWRSTPSLEQMNAMGKGTALENMGIEYVEVGDDFVVATMPVDHRTVQPMRLLHGGASVLLAESLGSVASMLVIDPAASSCVGLEINANHVRACRSGEVRGTCTAIHIGRTTHLWTIRIEDEQSRLVCIARLTVAILPKA